MFPGLTDIAHGVLPELDKSLVYGVLAGVILGAGTKIWGFINYCLARTGEFNISGNWISACKLRHDPRQIEIWHYSTWGLGIKLTVFTYPSVNSAPQKLVGRAVFRTDKLCAYYYENKRDSSDCGVVITELRAQQLVGAYALFDPKSTKETFQIGGYENEELTYKQRRLKLTRIQRTRILFGYRPGKTYAELNKILLDGGYDLQ